MCKMIQILFQHGHLGHSLVVHLPLYCVIPFNLSPYFVICERLESPRKANSLSGRSYMGGLTLLIFIPMSSSKLLRP